MDPGLVLCVGVLAVSSGSIFVRLSDAPPLVTAMWRMTFATVFLLPFAWWKARDELRSLTRHELGSGALAGLFLALHFATWIASLSFTSVANSTVFVNTAPLWVAIMSPWLTHERLSRRSWAGIGLSVIGGTIIGAGDFAGGTRALIGDALALAGSLALALYLLSGRRLRAKLSLPAYLAVCYTSAAIVLWIAVLVSRTPLTEFSVNTWGALLGMALISQHLGHSSYNWAMRYFSAGFIAVCLLGEPVGSSLLAWWLFDEGVTWMKAAGGLLILVSIYLASTAQQQTAP
ncbi:MAG: DMT family transporter [Prosthecobacter sp.]|uniref:DMT family transporter n=1 Tax=Prosthecobacter sp. TaxID=1965333 RepID=UPI0038FE44D3